MGKKRKLEPQQAPNVKHSPVEVVVEDVSSHPICLHGPTLLFSGEKGRFFACSVCRNKKECTIHITEEDWQKESVKKRNEKYQELIPKVDKAALSKVLKEVKSQHPSNRAYCLTCNELYAVTQTKKHLKEHRVITPLTDEQLAQPSTWLPALENDSKEAQYLFSKKSVAVILNLLKKNNISNILCVGTPSLFECASTHSFNALLLDYDARHASFTPPDKFLWYNMFNNHLFNGWEDEKALKRFLKGCTPTNTAIVLDPPFGGRVEPLIQTLRELSHAARAGALLPVVWAFPYFAEGYICNAAPEIRMHDYQVEYENHSKFQNTTKKGRKFGSPVRFFTNLPLESINLSTDKKYKLCDKCKVYVSESNRHCSKCNECTSKNGMTYKHCNECKKCVKPTYFHCKTCERCCQAKDHACGVVVESQSCFGCHQKGHKRADCPKEAKRRKQA